MPLRDLLHNVKITSAIDPAAIKAGNATTVGATIDTQGFQSLVFAIQAGVITDGTLAPALYEGDQANMSDEALVADGSLSQLGTVAAASFANTDDSVVKKIGYRGTKRYVRLKVTQAGATTGGFFCATAIQGHPVSAPVP